QIKAGAQPGRDPRSDLLRRLLAERLGCPAPALGLFGAGLLHLLTREVQEGEHIRPHETGDIHGLAARLGQASSDQADAARAGAFLSFLIDTYGVEGMLAFARAMQPGAELDDVARQATGKSLLMLSLQWGESVSREQ